MAETLILQCHDRGCDRVNWLISGSGASEPAEGDLSEASKSAKGRRTLVLIPATELLITAVKIPTRNRQRLLQAIPFSLENELTEDIDRLHFAAGHIDGENTTPVIVIAREKLDHWLETLESAGIEPMGIYPDLLCLPLHNDCWTLYQDNQLLLARTNPHQGFCVDTANGEAYLKLAVQQSGEHVPKQVEFLQLTGSSPVIDLGEALPDCDVKTLDIGSRARLTALLAGNLAEKQQINLLQGDYLRVDKMTLQWKRWLPAAVLASVFVGLSMALTLRDHFDYQHQSTELQARIRQTFQQAFPEVKRVVDPKVQMEQQLKAMQSGQAGGFAQFASLFVPSASVIKNSPDTTLEGVSYRDGQLNLQLTIKELQALETLKKMIEAKRLGVEIRSANVSGDQVSSHLRISGVK
ncbi:MAG: type II secretion system protein GspL [Candidatus Thiodiazotropha sp. (ex Epidulcina cf. delphinae)]|nr:type II secretion system protein GspL [Candidatus Thiodiazotropha sp. (ex Epidulcina cf. delphinae)]